MQQSRRFIATTSIVFLAMVGCGSDESQLKNTYDSNPEPTIIMMGGRTSCGKDDQGRSQSPFAMSLFKPLGQLLDLIKSDLGLEPKYIITCYGTNAQISYSLSSQGGDVLKGNRAEFDAAVERDVGDAGDVFFSGHSYGGWLAMKSSIELAGKRNFTGVATIDPISRVHCSFSKPAGCQSAPKDIPVAEKELIADQTDDWINLYQTKTFYLHSSPIAEADENIKIATTHNGIDTHRKTWELLEEMIYKQY